MEIFFNIAIPSILYDEFASKFHESFIYIDPKTGLREVRIWNQDYEIIPDVWNIVVKVKKEHEKSFLEFIKIFCFNNGLKFENCIS